MDLPNPKKQPEHKTTSSERMTREMISPVPDEESGLSADEKKTFRSLDEALQEQSEPAAKPLIQKVTNILRNKKDFRHYYVPIVMAIGPLHHGHPNLRLGEKFKLKLAALFIQESGSTKRTFYDKIKDDIENLKKCYEPGEIKKHEKKLALMLFVDGCAVLGLLHYLCPPQRSDEMKEELKIKNDMLAFMQQDLILLENQLPYRLIQTLISTASKEHGDELKKSIKNFIDGNILAPAEIVEKEKIQQQQQKDPAHLLELLRDRLLVEPERNGHCMGKVWRSKDSLLSNCRHKSPQQQMQQKQGEQQQQQKQEDQRDPYIFRNIKELKEKGVWLTPSETSSLKDVSFHRSIFTCFLGILKLPPIMVDDSTAPMLMNLIAYEMCPDFENDFEISSYIFFMDSLIDQAEDVKELRHSGILINSLGSDEEVAILFNKICTDLVPNLDLYKEVKKRIQKYCKNPLVTSAAQAYHTHFSTPWTFLAFVGAIAALALGATQTYFTIHPNSQ